MNNQERETSDWAVLSVIVVGSFLSVLTASIVNVAIPQMMVIFSANANQIQWILTAYMLVLGVMMPLAGYLGDTYGYKRMYCFSLGLFTLGSIFCGLSWSLNSMIFARVIQAMGGGLIQPLAMALIYRTYPPHKIGAVMGLWGIAAMAGPAIGPTVGGYLIEFANWRWMFLFTVPFGVLCFFLANLRLTETQLIKGHKFDYVGLVTIILGFSTLLMAISNGNKEGWTSPYIVGLFAVAAVSLTVLILTELDHPEPLLDLRLLSNQPFLLSVLLGSILSMGIFGGIFLMPMLMQNVMGLSAFQCGLLLLPAALGGAIMMPVGGRMVGKIGARALVIPGMALMAGASFAMSFFTAITPFSVMMVWMTVRMIGMGLGMMPITIAGMYEIQPLSVGRASSLNNVIRQVASCTGVAMFTSIMQHMQVAHLNQMAASINANSTDLTALFTAARLLAANLGVSAEVAQYLPVGLIYKRIALDSLAMAIGDSMFISACICAAGIFLAFLIKKPVTAPPPLLEEEELGLMEGIID
ncbi:MAG: DHA2 family efflux MFS transporter permease subunit [Solirubrobacterales bacterium]